MKVFCLLIITVMVSALSSCLKDNPAVDFGEVKPIIEISPPYPGEEYFDNALIDVDGSAQAEKTFVVNIASPQPLSSALTITLGVDDSSRVAYNSSHQTSFEALPAAGYSFSDNAGSIAAGARRDTISIVFYPAQIDSTKSYMLPVSIVDAQGQTISGNFHTIYYHTEAK